MRVAIYSRYSSEQQSEHSIDDSGATTNRPRLQALVGDARKHQFDVVLAEALDRISRDQEHIAGIWKGLYRGVEARGRGGRLRS